MTARSLTKSFALASTLAIIAAATAAAQGQQLFQWSGQVDAEIQLTMSGRSLTVSQVGRREPGNGQSSVLSALPRQDGTVTAQLTSGRGSVDVISQPTAANGYTAIVRIRDPQSGAGNYRINVYWQGNGLNNGAGAYGRGRGRDVNANGNDRRDNNRGGNNVQSFQWSGDVDGNTVIRLGPGGVSYRTVSGKDPRNVQSSFASTPRTQRRVTIDQFQGRGSVTVIQQPTAENGYTAAIRVVDPQGGYGHYNFTVTWR